MTPRGPARHLGDRAAAGPVTGDEFAAAYAQRSGVTVEWLAAHGRVAQPCDCDYDGCEGWQMAHVDAPDLHARARATLDVVGLVPFAELVDQRAAWRVAPDVYARLVIEPRPNLPQRLYGFDVSVDDELDAGALELVGWAHP